MNLCFCNSVIISAILTILCTANVCFAGEILGNSTVCAGDTCIYATNSVGEISWKVVGGEIVELPEIANSEVAVVWNLVGECSVSFNSVDDSATINITSFRRPEARIFGPVLSCRYSEDRFYYKSDNKNLKIRWDVANGLVQTPLDADTIFVVWNYSGTGYITLYAENENGCVDTMYHYIAVNETASPQVYGNTIACVGFLEDYYTPKQSVLRYKWEASNAHFIGPDNIDDVSIIWDSVGVQELTLTVTNSASGCEAVYKKSVDVSYIPQARISDFPDICMSSEKFVLYGGEPAGGYYSGNWVTDGQFMTSAAGPGEHEIYYNRMNAAGCIGSDTAKIVVRSTPAAPKIELTDNVLYAKSTAEEIQWYLDGYKIPGAASLMHKPEQTGTYTAVAGNYYGCTSPQSNKISIDMSGVAEDIGVKILHSDTQIIVESDETVARYRLCGIAGDELASGVALANSFAVPVQNIGAQACFLLLYRANGTMPHKIKVLR